MSSSEHNGKHFVIQKGKAMCDKGKSFPNFNVTSHQKHYWNDADGKADFRRTTAVLRVDQGEQPAAAGFPNAVGVSKLLLPPQ